MENFLMPLKTPKFWYKPVSFCAYALMPVAWFYQIGHFIFQSFTPKGYKASIPVICIGNAVSGGSGKTPTALAVMDIIKKNALYKNPYFLTRGYRGEITTPQIVDIQNYNHGEMGDEAYLLAQIAPTIISPNRAKGAKLAEENGADLIIMDDGLQNKSLTKDLTFLVIDRKVDFGNNKTIPAGPLREPLSRILPKTDAIICIGDALMSDKPVFETSIEPKTKKLEGSFIAFAGLGRPQKFLDTLEKTGANIIGWHEFADHHLYTQFEIDMLLKESLTKKAQLITTEKDWVRLPHTVKGQIKTFPIIIDFKDEDYFVTFLKKYLNK